MNKKAKHNAVFFVFCAAVGAYMGGISSGWKLSRIWGVSSVTLLCGIVFVREVDALSPAKQEGKQ